MTTTFSYTSEPQKKATTTFSYADEPAPSPYPEKPEMGDFRKGIMRGGYGLGGIGYGLKSLGQQAIGSEEGARESLEKYKQLTGLAGQYRGVDFADIKDISSGIDWAQGELGALLPTMVASLAGGGVGGFAGKKLAERAIKKQADKLVQKQIARKFIGRGSLAGAAGASTGLQTGSIQGDIYQETGRMRPVLAIPYGIATGAVDALTPGRIAGKLMSRGVAQKAKTGLAGRVGKEALRGMATEAPTEAIQSYGEQAALRQAQGIDPLGARTPQEIAEIKASAAAGGLGGLAFGGLGGVSGRAQPEVAKEEKVAPTEPKPAEKEVLEPVEEVADRIKTRKPFVPTEMGEPAPLEGASEPVTEAVEAPIVEKPTEREIGVKEPWEMTKKESESNFYEVNYVTKEGNKGKILADFYSSPKVAREKALQDPDIAKITSVKRQTPAEYEHESNVDQALIEGKLVPPEVLADYPNLKPTAGPVTVLAEPKVQIKPEPKPPVSAIGMENIRKAFPTGKVTEGLRPNQKAIDSLAQVEARFTEKYKTTQSYEWTKSAQGIYQNLQDQVDKGLQSYHVALPNGQTVTVLPDSSIILNEKQAKAASIEYGKEIKPGAVATGGVKVGKDSVMKLSKSAGQDTVDHESFHVAMQSVLTDSERKTILKKYGTEEKAAEAYETWNPAVVKDTLFRKILTFFRNIRDAIFPSAEKTLGEIKTGKVFERKPKVDGTETFQLKKDEGFYPSDETLREKFTRLAQDKFNRVKKVQTTLKEKGGEITEESDVYLAEELHHRRIATMLESFDEVHMKPLIEDMRKKNVSVESLVEFTYAKHAPERNEQILSIRPGFESGSGMSDADAKAIVEKHRKKLSLGKMESLAERVYAMNNLHLDLLEEYGLVGEETVKLWRDKYDFYMPLKGLSGEESAQPQTGRGFDVRGKQKQALGRKSRAENILSYAVSQVQETIVKGEKAEVGRSLLRLVRDNPDPTLWEIDKVVYKPYMLKSGRIVEGVEKVPEGTLEGFEFVKEETKEGKVVYAKDPTYRNREEVFAVKEGGKEYMITLKDPLLAQQMKNLNTEKISTLARGLQQVNRFLALINTALVPEFTVTNAERDIQTAIINIVGEQENGVKLAAMVMKDLPSATKAIFQETFKKGKDSAMRKEYRQLQATGGTIGFFGMESIEAKQERIVNQLEDLKKTPQAQAKRAIKAVAELVTDLNLSVENASRLAVYKNAKEMGMSEKRAASLAKNITVNFNRKGEWGNALNAAYLFYNASVQGSFRVFGALKHRKTQALVSGIAAVAYAVAEMNDIVGGDDDDGESHWSKVPDYVKETYLVIMKADGSGDYYKMKLPYGYNVFWNTGYVLHDVAKGHETVGEGVTNIARTGLNAFNPLGGSSDFLDMATPTALKPAEQHLRNLDWSGRAIKPKQAPYGLPKPASERAWSRTSPGLKSATRKLNELTGGSIVRPGAVDVSPEVIKHYLKWVTGGAGMFLYRSGTAIEKAYKDEEIDPSDVPFLRTVVGKKSRRVDADRFYTNAEEVQRVDAELDLKHEEDRVARSMGKQSNGEMEFRKEKQKVLLLRTKAKVASKDLTRIRKLRRKAMVRGDKNMIKKYEKQINDIYLKFNLAFNKASE